MELLFDETGTRGSSELKELLGFIDADLNYKNLKSDIRTATRDVIDLIGNEVYAIAIAAYNTDPVSNANKELIYAIRYPIAVNAYMLHAPSNDLAHTNNGRKMRQDDHQKLPFEWMLDRDNASLEKRYYRALEDLIRFLDDATDTILKTAWIGSNSYKLTHNLFIRTVNDFDRFFLIKSRYLLMKLVGGLEDCEQYEIRPRIGKDKFDSLKTKLKANTAITDEKEIELIRLIKKASVVYSLAWAMQRLSVNMFPDGILQHYTSDKATTRGQKPTLKSETEAARQAFMSDAKKVFIEIELLVAPTPTIDELTPINPNIIYGDSFLSA